MLTHMPVPTVLAARLAVINRRLGLRVALRRVKRLVVTRLAG
jgi:hypothetical protein